MRKKRKSWIGLVFLTAVLLITGCGGKTQPVGADSDIESVFHGAYIIDAEEAASKIGEEDVQFLDARGTKKAFLGTVDGAAVTDWQSISTCDEGNAGDAGWGLVPEPEKLGKLLGELGLDKEKQIIIIGAPEEGWGEDGRVLWELLQAGFRDVKIVDGGIEALKAAGVKLKMGGSSLPESEVTIDELDTSHDMTTEELQENYEKFKIVDVRTVEEYEGAILYDEVQGGHLPGAVNIPYVDLFQENGMLKSNEELTELFESNGLNKTDEIVTYCTGGIRSAYVQLVMEMCGYTHTYSYGQSFWRWAVVGEVE